MMYTLRNGKVAGLDRTTAPDNSPLLVTVKAHLRVDYADDDTLIQGYIDAAVNYIEQISRLSLFTQAWTITMDAFPADDAIRLPNGPVTAITTFTTYDEANTPDATFAGYWLDASGGRLVLTDGYAWPTDLRQKSVVAVEYVTGYGALEADIPANIKQAVLMLCGHWYENRETVVVGTISSEIGFSVQALVNSERGMRL